MLPGFRFLFAATLLTVSLLVFGLGAAALLRASHERFVNLPRQAVPAPVFAKIPDGAPPTLSMLRVEREPAADILPESHAARPVDTLLPTERIASLSNAPRVEETMPPPVVVEPAPDVNADIRPETPTVDAQSEPVLAAPSITPVEPATVATIEQPATVEATAVVAAELAQPQTATAPEPEITGATPPPTVAEPPLVNAKPIRKPPMPTDRPPIAGLVAASPDQAVAASAASPKTPVLRRRKPVVKRVAKPKRREVTRPAPPRPAAPNPASPFGAPAFGAPPFRT